MTRLPDPTPSRLPMIFGLANALIAVTLLAGAANLAETGYGRAPTPLGIAATGLVAAAWAGVAWLKGRDGSTWFPKVALAVLGVVVALLLLVTTLAGNAEADNTTVGMLMLLVLFVAAAPFHGIAGLLGFVAHPLNYVVAHLVVACVAGAAWLVGRAGSDVTSPGTR